jgi:hypothetical protein
VDGELIGDPSSQLNWSLGARLPNVKENKYMTIDGVSNLSEQLMIVNDCICCGPCVAIKRDYGGGHLKSTVRAHLDLLTNTVSYTYCNNTVQTSAVAVGALNLIESFIYLFKFTFHLPFNSLILTGPGNVMEVPKRIETILRERSLWPDVNRILSQAML